MWEPLQGLLASPSDDIKVQALWVIGTAIQNNPAAQNAVRSPLPRPHCSTLTFLSFIAGQTAVPRPRSSPCRHFLSFPLCTIVPEAAAPSQSDIRALWPPQTQRSRYRLVRHGGRVGRSARRFIRYRVLSPSHRPFSPVPSKALTLRAQTQTSPFGARLRFSSTPSSHPLSPLLPARRRLLQAQEFTGVATTPQWERLYTQTRTRRWWPTPHRSTRHPRRCVPCERTNCYPS
jgi:hypothetical protein